LAASLLTPNALRCSTLSSLRGKRVRAAIFLLNLIACPRSPTAEDKKINVQVRGLPKYSEFCRELQVAVHGGSMAGGGKPGKYIQKNTPYLFSFFYTV